MLAAWLRARREEAGMSQQHLATTAGVAVATVRNIETSVVVEPGYFTVMAIFHALGADPADLTEALRTLGDPPADRLLSE